MQNYNGGAYQNLKPKMVDLQAVAAVGNFESGQFFAVNGAHLLPKPHHYGCAENTVH